MHAVGTVVNTQQEESVLVMHHTHKTWEKNLHEISNIPRLRRREKKLYKPNRAIRVTGRSTILGCLLG